MKEAAKTSSGSLKIDPVVLEAAKKHCKESGTLISFFATEAIKEKLKKVKKISK